MEVSSVAGHKVYNLSAGKTLPEWLSTKKKSQLRKDPEFQRRIELVQDLRFPVASSCMRVSPDGRFAAVGGTYPPAVRLFELAQLSMKVERRGDADVLGLEFLSADFAKLAVLTSARTVELHAAYGLHHTLRLPRPGRALLYAPDRATLWLAGAGSDLWRVSLEHGQFVAPVPTALSGSNSGPLAGTNHLATSPVHGLVAAAHDGPAGLELLDPRQRAPAARLPLAELASACPAGGGSGLVRVAFAPADPVLLAAGSAAGDVLLFDIRARRPLAARALNNELPVQALGWHAAAGLGSGSQLLAADGLACRVLDGRQLSAPPLLSLAWPGDGPGLRDVCIYPGSGLVWLAGELPAVQSLYVPALGVAPAWCSFLDSLTEELEEGRAAAGASAAYDDFRFVTRDELEKLGVTKLEGSPFLRAYMHGYFIHHRLYARIRAIAQPFEFEQYRKDQVQARLAQQQQDRIRAATPRRPAVNARLAAQLRDADGQPSQHQHGRDNRQPAKQARLLADPRFAKLWTSADFEVQPDHPMYRFYHPTAPAQLEQPEDENEEQDPEHDQDQEEDQDNREEAEANEEEAEASEEAEAAPKQSSRQLVALEAQIARAARDMQRPLEQRVQRAQQRQPTGRVTAPSGRAAVFHFTPGDAPATKERGRPAPKRQRRAFR